LCTRGEKRWCENGRTEEEERKNEKKKTVLTLSLTRGGLNKESVYVFVSDTLNLGTAPCSKVGYH
jgi:hypothetical protein